MTSGFHGYTFERKPHFCIFVYTLFPDRKSSDIIHYINKV